MFPKNRKLLLLISILLAGVAVARPVERSEVLSRIKGVAVPLYVPNVSQPAAVVRVASFRKEYARKGFFRIGALPVWVAEDFSIEILKPEYATNLLGKFDDVLRKVRSDSMWYVRGFSVRHSSSDAPVLSAGTARPSSSGRWELGGNVRVSTLPDGVVLRRAQLSLRGPDSGRLEFVSSSGAVAFNVFAPISQLSKPHHPLHENNPLRDSVPRPSPVRSVRADH